MNPSEPRTPLLLSLLSLPHSLFLAMSKKHGAYLTLSLLFLLSCADPTEFQIPRMDKTFFPGTQKSSELFKISEDYETYFFNQTLDHFNYRPESYITFRQKYVVNFKHWGGASAKAPIFAYLGGEDSVDQYIGSIGFLPENAERFRALLIYMEVRKCNS